MQPKPTLKKLAIVGVSLLAALVLAELGLRGWLAIQGRAYSSSEVQSRMELMLDPIKNFMPAGAEPPTTLQDGTPLPLLHPYSGAELWHDTGNVLKHFRDYPHAESFKVLIVGGSVASFFALSAKNRLIELLSQAPGLAGRRITVLNYAHPAYKQPQQLNRVTYLLEFGAKPDAVINIDGFNEVALALENSHSGTNPLYPSPPTWAVSASNYGSGIGSKLESVVRMINLRDEARVTVERALRYHFSSSAILGTWTTARLKSITLRRNEAQQEMLRVQESRAPSERMQRQIYGPPFTADETERLNLCVTAWFEGSVSLDAVCRARGILYLHVLQPALGDTGSKLLDDIEKAIAPPSPDWVDGPRLGYPLLRERGKELVARGIHFVDATQTFAKTREHLYTDPCHFEPLGNMLLAERIAPELIALLAER